MSPGFFSSTIMLFLILDPVGNLPLAIALLEGTPPHRRWRILVRECAIAWGVLTLFLFFGEAVMRFMQISQSSLGLAGGLVLLLISLRMIFQSPAGPGDMELTGEPMVVPLAVPAIAGPSAMTMVMLLASQSPARLWISMGALCVAMVMCAAILVTGCLFIERIGRRAITALERLAGLLLSTFAVEMLLTGIRAFIDSLPGH